MKEFTQIGCELIGSESIQSDIQILRLALQSVSKTAVPSVVVRMGNIGLIRALLAGYGLNETICFYVLSNLATLRSGSLSSIELVERAAELGLVSDSKEIDESYTDLSDQESINDFLSQDLTGNTGRRSRSDIINRLIAKENTKVDSGSLSKAIDQLILFLKIAEEKQDLDSLSDIGNDFGNEVQEKVDELNSVIKGVGNVEPLSVNYVLDFSTSRGLTYYTGLIFDISLNHSDYTVVGGGGRYDGLVKMLGGSEDVPAVGFAINVDSLLSSVNSPDSTA